MVTSSNFSLIVLCFMVSSSLMVQTGVSREIPESSNAPEPSNESNAPEGSNEYLADCAWLLDPSCGDEIFKAIFFSYKRVTSECCDTLVGNVGKQCHDDMTKYILQSEKFPNINETQVLKRSQKVWNECILQDYHALQPTIFPDYN
ncbi:hypothetical protein Fmac_031704 [Flemingia macrophylla]|uniref:Prolamin-like domain-containing protein n=1 Tax=Flemingia macrophylla TaxID=520843 RepID=A0ABD1L397_9FABA